ncbi:hypothetical protein [Flavobacterium sp. RS13.1]|uniref:hypothetical protein n=1 Tax=Flavobacterium sp. RS13.1 TaxID=3400345 RepID=UPI003AB0A60D
MSTDHNRIKVADLEKNESDKILLTNTIGELEFKDISEIKTDSYNALDYTAEGKALDARQGKALKDLIDTINQLLVSDNVNLNTIQKLGDAIETVQNSLSTILVNDLTTGGTTKALTAEMGKLLQTNKVDKVSGERLLNAAEIVTLSNLSANLALKQDIDNQIEWATTGLVQDSWHGKLVIFKGNITITVPASGLRNGFTFEGIVDPTFTVNTAITAPKAWYGTYTGTAIPANSIFTFLQRASDSNKISIFGL